MASLPIYTDVLVVGSGPSGYMAALTLRRYGVNIRVIDQSTRGPQTGHATGIQPRTLEILHSMNLLEELEKDGNRFHAVSFWSDNQNGQLSRTHTSDEVVAETAFKYVLAVGQDVTERVFDKALRARGVNVERPVSFVDLRYVDDEGSKSSQYPLLVRAFNRDTNVVQNYRVKYVIGSDGAKSRVRQCLGFDQEVNSTPEIWTVTDCEIERTDFPDIRRRSMVSTTKGSVHLIPMVDETNRVYTQLTPEDLESLTQDHDRNELGTFDDTVLLPFVQRRIKNVLHPFTMKLGQVKWISEYNVQQQMTPKFIDHLGRVILVGDACHSHSPKAAQGLNTSMQDAYNLTWKLALVLKGVAKPSLLDSYESERVLVARQLINFDLQLSKSFANDQKTNAPSVDDVVERSKAFTSGLGIQYPPEIQSGSTGEADIVVASPDTLGVLSVGKRFPLAYFRRVIDWTPVNLLDDLPSFGRYHIIALTGQEVRASLKALEHLDSPSSPLSRFAETTSGWHRESVRHFAPVQGNESAIVDFAVIFPVRLDSTDWLDESSLLRRWRWRIYSDEHGFYYEKCKIDTSKGALAIVRPDGYVGAILELADAQGLREYFRSIFCESQQDGSHLRTSIGKIRSTL